MNRVLYQDEIDALIASTPTDAADGRADAPVVPYNFRRPDRVSKDQIRSLQFIHERIAGSKILVLDAAHLTSVEQHEAFTNAVSNFLRS